jgi:hypothetical protein
MAGLHPRRTDAGACDLGRRGRLSWKVSQYRLVHWCRKIFDTTCALDPRFNLEFALVYIKQTSATYDIHGRMLGNGNA